MINYYCIYDNSLQLANLPFPARDNNEAVSMVRNMLLSADDSILKRISSVCELRLCGTFDQETASFDPVVSARTLCALSDIPLPSSVGGDS